MLKNYSKSNNEKSYENRSCSYTLDKLYIDSQRLLDNKDNPDQIIQFLTTYRDYLEKMIRGISGYYKNFDPIEHDEEENIVLGAINQAFLALKKEIYNLQQKEERIELQCNLFVYLRHRLEECYFKEKYYSNNIISIPNTSRYYIKKYKEMDEDFYRENGIHMSNDDIRKLVLNKMNASDDFILMLRLWAEQGEVSTESLTIVPSDDYMKEYDIEEKKESIQDLLLKKEFWNKIEEIVSENDNLNYKILYYYYHHGYSLMDISKLIGKHYNTVRKRYLKSINRLRESASVFADWL